MCIMSNIDDKGFLDKKEDNQDLDIKEEERESDRKEKMSAIGTYSRRCLLGGVGCCVAFGTWCENVDSCLSNITP